MKRRLISVGIVACLLGWLTASAEAAWPSGGLRVISGKDCTPFLNAIDAWIAYCPFVSDSDSYYGANNTGIYVDFNVSSQGDNTAVDACRQSWTGTAVSCGTSGWSSGTGYQDILINGYAYISGTPDVYDSFYVEVVTFGSVDKIYGLSHQ